MRQQVTWLYRPAKLDMIKYSNEIRSLFDHLVPDLSKEEIPHFLPLPTHNLIKEFCPDLFDQLQQWGVDQRLAECAFIIIPPGKQFPIHRDYPSWKFRNIGLIMPVLNCENSYTVFYEANVVDETLGDKVGGNSYANRSQHVDDNSVKEIGRCLSNQPHWINVYQPHAPVVNHNQYRVTFSIRFRPELFDIIASGKFDHEFVA